MSVPRGVEEGVMPAVVAVMETERGDRRGGSRDMVAGFEGVKVEGEVEVEEGDEDEEVGVEGLSSEDDAAATAAAAAG